MSIQMWERPQSRQTTGQEPSVTFLYGIAGETDEQTAQAYAIANTPASYVSVYGTLYRQDVKLDPVGSDQFNVTIPYGKNKREAGQWSFTFDTTGGTVHITNSKQTRNVFAQGVVSAPLHGGAIGVHGDTIDGTDITIPALKLSVSFTHPEGEVTLAKVKQLANITGTVNSQSFMTFEPGEVLFLGASGSDGSESEASVSYQFACSANADDLTFGDVANVVKRGWDAIWIHYQDDTDDGRPVKKPQFVYVERVYEEIDLAGALGFG